MVPLKKVTEFKKKKKQTNPICKAIIRLTFKDKTLHISTQTLQTTTISRIRKIGFISGFTVIKLYDLGHIMKKETNKHTRMTIH